MNVNKAGLELIQEFESLRLNVYKDAAGLDTIGWGHLLTPEQRSGGMETITREEADVLLVKDLFVAERAVERHIRVPLDANQFSALVSFTFNLGSGALQRSTLRHKLNAGDYDEVPDELLRWCYAGGRKLAGLLRRRHAEATLWEASGQTAGSTPPPPPASAIQPWWRGLSNSLSRSL
jgi:lysozyme